MFIKPATPDKRVLDPAKGQYLPVDGADVGEDNGKYWSRRLADADVVECVPDVPTKKK
jgi:hypothetical protein